MMKVRSWITATIFVGMIGLSGVILTPTATQVIAQVSEQDGEALEEAVQLNKQAYELYQQGKYNEAISLSKKALVILKENLGENHAITATGIHNLAVIYYLQGIYTEAEPLYKEALAIRKEQLGDKHPDTAQSLSSLALLYSDQRKYVEAEPLLKQAFAIYKEQFGEIDDRTFTTLNYLVELYKDQGKYTEAETLLKRALAIRKEKLGDNHLFTAQSLNTLARFYELETRYADAEPLFQESLAIIKQQLGDNHPTTATILNNLARLYQSQARYTEAEPLLEEVLAIRTEQLGVNHPLTIISLSNLAGLYQSQARYAESESLLKQILAIRKQKLGENHRDTAGSLNDLGYLYYFQGRYKEAEPLTLQALAIRTEQLGVNHPLTIISVNNLVEIYKSQARYDKVESFYQRVLEITKEQLGDNHINTANSLNNLAIFYEFQGRYTEAEPLYQRVLEITKEQLGDNHINTASSLNNLAGLYHLQGRYADAKSLLKQVFAIKKALVINQQQLGDNRLETSSSLNGLAGLYQLQGRYTEAEPLFLEALAIRKKRLGENHPLTASSLNNLATLYQLQGRYSEAEPLLKQALAIRKKQLGESHPLTVTSLESLAALYTSQERYTDGEPLFLQVLDIRKQKLGDNHPLTAVTFNNLAALYTSQERYTDGEPLFLQVLDIRKQKLGDNHPLTAATFNNLAGFYQLIGNIPEAINYLAQGIAVEEYNISENLKIGDDKQKQDYIQTVSETTNKAISLNLQSASDNPKATQLAFKTILERKGRILDISTNSLQILRQRTDDPKSQQLLTQLIEVRTQLSNITFTPVDKFPSPTVYRQELTAIQTKAKKLEDKLSRRSAEFRQLSQPITLEAIQQQIPKNSALVEIVRYRPFNTKATQDNDKFGDPRYAVYILFPNGQIEAKDLGEATIIEDDLREFTKNLADISQNGIPQVPINQLKVSARQLDAKLMQPIRELLGETKTILLSPDGALNLIPFEALVDENNQYLVENYKITYLTSGRDLLRLKEKFISEQPPLILANPTYTKEGEVVNLNPTQNYSEENQTRSVELSEYIKDTVFLPLSGTEKEAEVIQNILQLPKNRVLTEKQATEDALKQVRKPNILHIATHGFFLESKKTNDNEPSTQTNPLLYSGLVLAGVKADIEPRRRTGDNGILTALETTALNLVGTKLVVLSACDTGRGDITTGEGIYGLRRALVIAGSESQLISLWKVSDNATKNLMVDYYKQLKDGKGRSEALRNVQLEMLKNEDQSHPFYWAGFIPSGDWTPMEFNSAK